MYDGVAILKDYGDPVYDEYGNEILPVVETQVYVQPRGVYQSEFYNAAQLGLKPSITFFIANRYDYEGQKIVTYNGLDYEVIRVDWNAQRDGISLICEERVSNGETESISRADARDIRRLLDRGCSCDECCGAEGGEGGSE